MVVVSVDILLLMVVVYRYFIINGSSMSRYFIINGSSMSRYFIINSSSIGRYTLLLMVVVWL